METTKGHHIIMGRKNYESIPPRFRPLPQRVNIIVTRQNQYPANNCVVVHSVEDALQFAEKQKESEVFVIGGAEIYQQLLPMAQRLYLTEIQTILDGDTFFPNFDQKAWKEKRRSHHPADARHAFAFDFAIYERN
jgi:dihydrofolate reductase